MNLLFSSTLGLTDRIVGLSVVQVVTSTLGFVQTVK